MVKNLKDLFGDICLVTQTFINIFTFNDVLTLCLN